MHDMIVARFLDGSLIKGTTCDFSAGEETFHVIDEATGEATQVSVPSLKAVFFVKTFSGDKDRKEHRNVERAGLGKKVMVHFKDGEIMLGYTPGYLDSALGFFVFPSDPYGNNDRVFVINAATKKVEFLVPA